MGVGEFPKKLQRRAGELGLGGGGRNMSLDAKQKDWVWEYFLRNCNDARVIQELLNVIPFPKESLELNRMFLLRALSVQVSKGLIDEKTLDILRGLGEASRISGAGRGRKSTNFSSQEAPKRRKLCEKDSNDDEVVGSEETEISAIPSGNDGKGIPTRNSSQRRESSKDGRKAEAVVGIRDWMKGRALPRSVGGSAPTNEQMKGNNSNNGGVNGVNEGTPHGAGSLSKGARYIFKPGQYAKHWELELAVMLELAVKHLRGNSPDRKSFEQAVIKHWGESSLNCADEYGSDSLDAATVREQLQNELRMVPQIPDRLDVVVEKYTKARVEDMLKSYLEKAWASTGQTFLKRVSADVVNGKYKPVNSNGQRSKKTGSPFVDVEAVPQSNGKVDSSDKPWTRASRGRHSRSREKLQKNFAIWELDGADEGNNSKLPVDERSSEGERAGAEQQAGRGGSTRLDGDASTLNNKTSQSGEIRPSLITKVDCDINARSQNDNFRVADGGVARVLEFDELSGPIIEDGMQHCQEKEDSVRADVETTEAEQTDGTGVQPCGGADVVVTVASSVNCVPDTVKVPQVVSNAMGGSEGKETSAAGDEKRTKEASSPTNEDWLGPEPGCPHEVVNKENVMPPSSPRPTDPYPTVRLSTPPCVEESPGDPVVVVTAPGLTRKKKSGSVPEESEAGTRNDESRSADAAVPADSSNQSPATRTTQLNLRRKQRVLDAVVQDPLPRILTTRSKGNLLDRNATARTVEWEEDEIEESPSKSPSTSKHVRLRPTTGKVISPLIISKTSRTVNGKQARRKPRRWSENEVQILKTEVRKYGKGHWKMILQKNLDNFQGRTEVDLKDKWRNIERFEGVKL